MIGATLESFESEHVSFCGISGQGSSLLQQMPGPRTDQAKSPWKRFVFSSGALFNEESAATRPHDMRRSPQQHSTTKSAIQQAQPIISHPDAHEVMEVSADAGTKLHDHQFLQFVGHPVLASFTNLILLFPGNPHWSWFPCAVTSGTSGCWIEGSK